MQKCNNNLRFPPLTLPGQSTYNITIFCHEICDLFICGNGFGGTNICLFNTRKEKNLKASPLY